MPAASPGCSVRCARRRRQRWNRPMLRIEFVYWLCGAVLLAAGLFELRDRRFAHAAFWTILAACFFGGDAVLAADKAGNAIPAQVVGLAVVIMALIAGSGRLQRKAAVDGDAARRRASAERLRNRLFMPALAIPVVTLVLIVAMPYLKFGEFTLFDSRQSTLVALGTACVVAAG